LLCRHPWEDSSEKDCWWLCSQDVQKWKRPWSAVSQHPAVEGSLTPPALLTFAVLPYGYSAFQ
jgi:hypothetical protein